MINQTGIIDLIKISHYASNNKGYIQGGGGNTSVKLDDQMMAVKASGCKLSQIDYFDGYVIVDYKSIREYFAKADSKNPNFHNESEKELQLSIRPHEGLKELRPSVEAGFHSLLKKYVIHTHSVYSNILCCSKEGKSICEKIFEDMNFIWLPYIDPGAKLTLVIKNAIDRNGSIPDAIFMQNHGVIVTADDSDEVIKIHEDINTRIRTYFELPQEFPNVLIEEFKEDQGQVIHFKSASPFLKVYFEKNLKELEILREKVLYPDQLVYLNNSIYKKDGSRSDIQFIDGTIVYTTSYTQAEVNEETLVAYLFVTQMIKEKNLTLVSLNYEQQAFILGWESESYRKSMLK